jgi:hypothetical protein
MNATNDENKSGIVYWHRALPPLDAEFVTEHTVEADSSRVPGTIAHRDELWAECYRELVANAEGRLVQEVARLGDRALPRSRMVLRRPRSSLGNDVPGFTASASSDEQSQPGRAAATAAVGVLQFRRQTPPDAR